jgi:hypothetical protein
MLSWLADNAATLYLLLGIAVLILAALWWMTPRRGYLLGLVIVFGLIGIVWLLSVVVVTDQVLLERACREIEHGIQTRDVERVFKHIAKSFNRANQRPMTRTELHDLARRELGRHGAEDISFSKITCERVSREEGSLVQFWVHGVRELENLPIRCEADFVFEDDLWRMKGFKLFIGNTNNQYGFP